MLKWLRGKKEICIVFVASWVYFLWSERTSEGTGSIGNGNFSHGKLCFHCKDDPDVKAGPLNGKHLELGSSPPGASPLPSYIQLSKGNQYTLHKPDKRLCIYPHTPPHTHTHTTQRKNTVLIRMYTSTRRERKKSCQFTRMNKSIG